MLNTIRTTYLCAQRLMIVSHFMYFRAFYVQIAMCRLVNNEFYQAQIVLRS